MKIEMGMDLFTWGVALLFDFDAREIFLHVGPFHLSLLDKERET